ncbi:hypothetical protein [Occallatibacter savannae]|uniref:hypothetical protein n=1 Tax=Occallatibacter savannae TaxID=1002691 RepID=UPI000D68716D|nr:hypothetical protein [Occallatibacter savannae]
MENRLITLAAYFVFASAISVSSTAQSRCHEIGGSIETNFVDSSDTLGSATGDLAGGLGVHVLSQEPGPDGTIAISVQHHWVTAVGDIISLDQATITLFPTSVPGFYAARYLNGVTVNGSGTGRFAGASGKLSGWGGVDFSRGALVLRYSGKICHRD